MSDPRQATIDQAEAQANYIRRYWEEFGASVRVTVRLNRWAATASVCSFGADGLPTKWLTGKHKAAYVAQAKTAWPHFILYLNRDVLPAYGSIREDE